MIKYRLQKILWGLPIFWWCNSDFLLIHISCRRIFIRNVLWFYYSLVL